MKVIDAPDWRTFEQKVHELREEYHKESSSLLFRGQGNSDWELKTTLDRNTYWTVTDTPSRNARFGMTLLDYYNVICCPVSQAGSLTCNSTVTWRTYAT
jgi:hypothetical protein